MKPVIGAIVACAAFTGLAVATSAQELGEATRGLMVAETICAECHAIQKGAPRSPNGNAPAFQSIARAPGMTALALRVALRTPHREMPNLVLKDDQIDDIIAYLATLK